MWIGEGGVLSSANKSIVHILFYLHRCCETFILYIVDLDILYVCSCLLILFKVKKFSMHEWL